MSRRLTRDFASFNNDWRRKKDSASTRDCANEWCGQPTTGDRFCQKCQNAYDRMLADIDRAHPELRITEPDPGGGVGDPMLRVQLGMSIIAATMDAEREREQADWDRRNVGDRFE